MDQVPTHATPGHMIRRAGQLHDRYFDEEFGGAVTARQYALMLALGREGVSDQVTLSQMIAVDRSTVGDIVARLVRNGLITRERDKEDGRRSVLRLSPEGERVIRDLSPQIDAVNRRLFEPLTSKERDTLVQLLTKIATVDDPTFPEYHASILRILGR